MLTTNNGDLLNNLASYRSLVSARSKVRGTLEIYHAYIRDSSDASDTSRGEADWEIVDNNSTTVSVSLSYQGGFSGGGWAVM